LAFFGHTTTLSRIDVAVHRKNWFFIDEMHVFLTFHRRTARKKR